MTIDMTDAARHLLVPAGTPLIAGKLYLHLCHGRKNPAEQMDDWGFHGPTFGPLDCVAETNRTTLRLIAGTDHELELDHYDNLIVWDGAWYGDVVIFIASACDRG
jgi:hypothetical protein